VAISEPYAIPKKLARDLARTLSYWQGLKRRQADIPFWDDVNLSALPDLRGKLAIIEVTDRPARFRFGFDVVGDDIETHYGNHLGGKFLDEIDVHHLTRFLASQCSATLEIGKPTYYRSTAKDRYSRLLAPLWGNGRIGMLLAAFEWG
jgi:hypothetical protein